MGLRAVVFGVMLVGIGAVGGLGALSTSNWVPAKGTVLSIDTSCEMKSTERGILTKTTTTATIDCDLVPAFKSLHSDKVWTTIEHFDAKLRVERDGVAPVVAPMALHRVNKRAPQIGDVIDVAQNPAKPEKIQPAGQSGQFSLISVGILAAGLVLLWLGTRGRRSRVVAGAQTITPPQPSVIAAPMAPVMEPRQAQRTTYVPPVREPAITSGRRVFGRRS
jgi:hypothetical protein